MQWSALERFLREDVAPNPFHRRRAEAAGIELASISSLQAFLRLPLMRKEDVVADQISKPPFGSIFGRDLTDVIDITETSGTTGKGSEVYPLTRSDLDAVVRIEAFGFFWAGVQPGRIVATTFPLTTRAAGRWQMAAVHSLGGVYLALGTYDTAKKLEYLTRFPVHLLVATPAYLRRLEVEAERLGLDIRAFGVKALLTAGEPFTTDWVRERQERWGATLYEQYGSTQRAIAWTCEAGASRGDRRGVLHTLPNLEFVEVIDPATGQPTPVGEFGELVITPFSCSSAAPLLRFASGDRVRWLGYDACDCGRRLPAIEAGNIQRFDDMLKVKGVNIFPEAIDAVVLHEPVLDYEGRVEQDADGRERLTVAVEFAAAAGDALKRECLQDLSKRLSSLVGLSIVCEEHRGSPLAPDMRQDVKKRRRLKDLRRARS